MKIIIATPIYPPEIGGPATYTKALCERLSKTHVIYVQNAMAAGLPVALVHMITGVPFVLKFVGDEAWERASQHRRTTKNLEEFMKKPDGGIKTHLMMMIQGF